MTNFDDLLDVINIAESESNTQTKPSGEHAPHTSQQEPGDVGKKDVHDVYGAQFRALYGK